MDLKKTGELMANERKAAGLTQAELAAQYPDDGSWSTSTGSVEQGLIYFQEFILLALGAVFVRYFLSEKKN